MAEAEVVAEEISDFDVCIWFSPTFADRMNVQPDISDKKDLILRTTLELIKDNGFHGTPISLIAKTAGVAAGTIYHYFPSKDAIIIEIYNRIRLKLIDVMFTNIHPDQEYRKQFFHGWRSLVNYFINNPGSLIFIEQYNSSPYPKTSDEETSGNKFSRFFEEGIRNGYVKRIGHDLISSVVFGCIINTAKYHIAGRYDYTDDDLCKIANILWDGIKSN